MLRSYPYMAETHLIFVFQISSIYDINRVKNVLPHSALLSLYYALFHSHIIYGMQVWGHSAPAKKMYNMQKKIVRIINNKYIFSNV